MSVDQTRKPAINRGLQAASLLRRKFGLPVDWRPEHPDVITLEVTELYRWLRDRGLGG